MKQMILPTLALLLLSTSIFATNKATTTVNCNTPTEEIKVKLQNKGADKIEILYQKKAGSKDLTGATINKSHTITITVESGCEVYYKVKGSKGPLILTVTASLNGKTHIIKN